MPMQPSPRAETSRLLLPSLRFFMGLLRSLLSLFQPAGHLLHRLPLLIGLHRDTGAKLRFRGVAGEAGWAIPQPVTTMGDEGDQGLPGQIVRGQEGANDRWGGLSPDGKAQIDGVVGG